MEKTYRGIILSKEGLGTFGYIPELKERFLAFARGNLIKKQMKKIFVGDYFEGVLTNDRKIIIENILPRKNQLFRPKIANVDKVLLITTIKNPPLNTGMLDKLLVAYDYYQVEPVIVFNKIDLLEREDEKKELKKWEKIYSDAGYTVVKVSAKDRKNLDELISFLHDNICVFAGASGVGKSSLISQITGVEIKTKEVSRKTKRGRHTTVGASLIPFGENSFIGDTAGFSKVDLSYIMDERELSGFFREFCDYTCKFNDCLHITEPQCGVKEAVEEGRISRERYNSYLKILEEDFGVNIKR